MSLSVEGDGITKLTNFEFPHPESGSFPSAAEQY